MSDKQVEPGFSSILLSMQPQISLQKFEIFAEGLDHICRARVGIRGQLLANRR
jgi:hypothetical protein